VTKQSFDFKGITSLRYSPIAITIIANVLFLEWIHVFNLKIPKATNLFGLEFQSLYKKCNKRNLTRNNYSSFKRGLRYILLNTAFSVSPCGK
jgi:hypothetical protein